MSSPSTGQGRGRGGVDGRGAFLIVTYARGNYEEEPRQARNLVRVEDGEIWTGML